MDKASSVKTAALVMRGVAIAAMRDPAIKVAADVNWTVNAASSGLWERRNTQAKPIS